VTARLKKVAIFGEGIYSRSPLVTRQRRLNCYLEVRKDKDKSSIVCYGTPGLELAFNASTPQNLPARGMIGNLTGLYEVSSNQVLALSSSGATLRSGAIGSASGLVGMALNPTQLLVVDGSVGYIWPIAGGAVTTIGASFPNGAQTATYCNGFFICELPGTNEFFVSDLNDGTTWSGLAFAAAVQSIDGIIACDTLGGLLIVFSSGHVEFWQNVGAAPEPFQYIGNSAQMYGLGAVNGRVHAGNALFFLSVANGGSFQNSGGSYQIARIRGYSVDVVSTTDVDNILQTMARTSTVADCTAFSYHIDEHIFCQFNFPTANRSLLLDTATNFWSEVQSGVTQGYAARHLGNLAAGAYGQTFVGDYSNGNVYTFNPGIYTDNGNTIVRQVVTRCGLEDFNTFRVGQIYLDMRTGVGLSSPSAQGYAPLVSLSAARDNRSFGRPRYFSLGAQGEYMQRVISRRWGRAKQFTLKIEMTDPVPFEITSAAMLTSMRQGRTGATSAKAAA